MVFWGDYTGLPMTYKGWNVVVGEERKSNKHQLTTACMKLLEWLQDYMSVDTVTLLLPNEDRQNLSVYATIGLEEEIRQQIRIPIGQGFAGRIAATNRPMIVNDLSTVEISSPILRQKRLQALVGIPLPIKQGKTGVLHVGTFRNHRFTQRDVQQLELVAHRLKFLIADTETFNFVSDVSKASGWQWLSLIGVWLASYHSFRIGDISMS